MLPAHLDMTQYSVQEASINTLDMSRVLKVYFNRTWGKTR